MSDNQMNVLVFADGNSVWVYNFLLLFQDSEIEMTLWSPYRISDYYRDSYVELGTGIIESPEFVYNYLEKNKHSIISKVLFLFGMIRSIMKVSRIRTWNIVNVHYVNPRLLIVFKFFPSIERKLVLSYWGSDLMREDRPALMRIRDVVGKSLACTFENDNLKQLHEKLYAYSSKRMLLMLPLPLLDDIDKEFGIRNSTCINIDGKDINREKISICVGYNGRRQQQHDRVLEQLEKLDRSIKERILLIFPFTYSVDKNDTYIDDLKGRINESGIESLVFERMLSNEELARLRLVTDVFINAQTTDAFSGSICEVLYAGGKLVNPKWLHYSELDIYQLEYDEYSDFSELPKIIENLVRGYDRNSISVHNRDVMSELRSMRKCEISWRSFFNKLLL